MNPQNINWHLIDQLQDFCKQQFDLDIPREIIYKSLITQDLIYPNGMPTKLAVKLGLVSVKKIKVGIKEDGFRLNPKIHYSQILISYMDTYFPTIINQNSGTHAQKINHIYHHVRDQVSSKRATSYDGITLVVLMSISYQIYLEMKNAGLVLDDQVKLKQHFNSYCHSYNQLMLTKGCNEDQILGIVSLVIKQVKNNKCIF